MIQNGIKEICMLNFLRNKLLQIKFYLVVFLGLPICLVSYTIVSANPNEYQMKAIYLYNFTKFITWPNTVFTSVDTPFQICILGDDSFNSELEKTIKDGTVKGRHLEVRHLAGFQEIKACHILFISHSEQPRLTKILTYTKQSPILTVSEIDDFVIQGGMIQFYMLENRVRFSVDPQTLIEADLKASSQLLQLAKIIKR